MGWKILKYATTLCIYGYPAAVVLAWMLMRLSGDRWWFGTVLLYGPRWIYALPLLVLVPVALCWNRHWLWPLGATALLVAGPVMGWNLQSGAIAAARPADLRVLTYNIHRWDVSAERFADLLEEQQADIAAVQECAPERWILPAEWHVERAGYSLVVSRYPIERCEVSKRGREVNGLYCVIATPQGPLGFACVDILTPRRALDQVLDRETVFDLAGVDAAQSMIGDRWAESRGLRDWIESYPEQNKIIAGDFNLTVDSPLYRAVWTDYLNAFSWSGFGYGSTKFTKINRFRYLARIDHVLVTPGLSPVRAWVGPDCGSDHFPLIADLHMAVPAGARKGEAL